MRSRHVTALLLVLIFLPTLAPFAVHAQYTEGLPPGILGVEIDGQPIDSVSVPTTDSATPRVSGTVDPGTAVIELAVANGNVIRFPAEVNQNGRFRASVPQALGDGQYTLYLNDVLVGAFVVAGAAPAEREPGRFLDIARVVPYPADFADAIPGLGFLDGRFFTLDEEAARTATSGDEPDARVLERRLAEAGWLQRYENRLAAPNPADPLTFSAQISSFIVEYASGADARNALGAVAGAEAGTEFATIGDESVLTLLSGTTPDTATEYQAARLVFRVGPMLGMIVYADLTNAAPDLTLLESVAQTVAARGVFVADRQVVPLGSMSIRLDGSPAIENLRHRDLYDARGGALTSLYGEDDAARTQRIELLSGTTDAFSSTTSGVFAQGSGARSQSATGGESNQEQQAGETPTSVIGIEGEESAPAAPSTPAPAEASTPPAASPQETVSATMTSSLFAFPGESEADVWLGAQRDGLLASIAAGDTSLGELTDSPALGDATVAFATRRSANEGDEIEAGYRIYTRTGAIVAVIDVATSPEITLRAAASLMEDQLACLEAEGCAGPVTLPNNLFGIRQDAPASGGDVSTPQPQSETPAGDAQSVITIEGEESGAEATSEPRENRQRRRDRNDQEDDANAGSASG